MNRIKEKHIFICLSKKTPRALRALRLKASLEKIGILTAENAGPAEGILNSNDGIRYACQFVLS